MNEMIRQDIIQLYRNLLKLKDVIDNPINMDSLTIKFIRFMKRGYYLRYFFIKQKHRIKFNKLFIELQLT